LPQIERDLRANLTPEADLLGLSSLAEGADQLFARAVLALGGSIEAVIPSAGYEATFSGPALVGYRRLLKEAVRVHKQAFGEPGEDAFFSAGKYIVDNSDRLIAIWDGEAAVGLGGTGDVVQYARKRGVDVTVIWPPGAVRG
jgi:hypothetical protein